MSRMGASAMFADIPRDTLALDTTPVFVKPKLEYPFWWPICENSFISDLAYLPDMMKGSEHKGKEWWRQ